MGITQAQFAGYDRLNADIAAAHKRQKGLDSQIAKLEPRPGNSIRDKMFYTDRDTTWGKVTKTAQFLGILGVVGGGVLSSRTRNLDVKAMLGLGQVVAGAGSVAAHVTNAASNDSILKKSPGQQRFDTQNAAVFGEHKDVQAQLTKLRAAKAEHVIDILAGVATGLVGTYDHNEDGRIHIGRPDSMVVDERVEKDGGPPDEHTDKVHTHYGLMQKIDGNRDNYVDRREIVQHLAQFNRDGDNRFDKGEHRAMYEHFATHKREVDDYKYFRASDSPS